MEASLYERLGGTEGITKIASDLVDIHLANPRIAPRYAASDVAAVKNGAATFFIAELAVLMFIRVKTCSPLTKV